MLPFDTPASRYYSHLGVAERKAGTPLEPLQGDEIVGAISKQWREWKRVGAPRRVVDWLKYGVPLKWRGTPPKQKVSLENNQPEVVREELDKLVEAGAFVEQECKVISPTFVLPKKDGSYRLIHDLRQINVAMDAPRFKMRGAKEAADVVRASGALVTLDLARGYQQVAVAKEARSFLGAAWRNTTVASTVLPFGLSLSAYVFTRLTAFLARLIRQKCGLNVAIFVDDFLLGSIDKETLEIGLIKVRELFKQLGVRLSPKTSQIPREEVSYLGCIWNAREKTVSIDTDRRKEYLRRVKNLLRTAQTRKTWQQVIGKLLFLRQVIGPTLRHTRSLMHAMRKRNGDRLIVATEEARQDLLWWREQLSHPITFSLIKKPVSVVISTDASNSWLGGVVEFWGEDGKKVSERRIDRVDQKDGRGVKGSKENQLEATTGRSIIQERKILQREAKDPGKHINLKEIEALYRALKENRESITGKSVLWFTDSTVGRAAIARQGTQGLGQDAWCMTKKVLDLIQELRVRIIPRCVIGKLNCQADSLSRPGENRDVWEEAIAKATNAWGPLQMDPWGSVKESRLEVETLAWRNYRTLMFPPIDRIAETVELIHKVSGIAPNEPPTGWKRMVVLITPLWRGAVWWPQLSEMRHQWLHLGRLPHKELKEWERRNGHPSSWTASLIPVAKGYGHPEQ